MLQVSGPDPLGMADVSVQPLPDLTETFFVPLPPARPDESEIPWRTLKLMGMVGGIVLLLVIIVTTIIQHLPRLLGRQ